MNSNNVATGVALERNSIGHIQVSTALGDREKPEGRPLPKPTSNLEGFEKYLQRAIAIDYKPDPAHILYEKLKIVLAESNILIYDDKSVDEWMLKLVKKQRNMTWVWKSLTRPLGELAKKDESLWSIRYQHTRFEGGIDKYVGEVDQKNRYTKIIPEAVLTTAETILRHFKKTDPICLLVSDYAVLQPDPFLAVAVPQFPFLIVDFWDEPGFQPKAADIDTQRGINQ